MNNQCNPNLCFDGVLALPPVGVGDEEIVGAVKVVVEPGVDFYPALRASEFRPAEVVHVQADCRRVDELQIFHFLSASPAAEKFVVLNQMEIKFLKDLAGTLFICMGKVRPRDMCADTGMVQVVVACNRFLDRAQVFLPGKLGNHHRVELGPGRKIPVAFVRIFLFAYFPKPSRSASAGNCAETVIESYIS